VELERQVNELKAKCEQTEKRAQEQRQVEEKKHAEEIQFLKRTNQQLKVHYVAVAAPVLITEFNMISKHIDFSTVIYSKHCLLFFVICYSYRAAFLLDALSIANNNCYRS